MNLNFCCRRIIQRIQQSRISQYVTLIHTDQCIQHLRVLQYVFFYVEQQQRIADFANKVHAGEITNAAGEKFTTVVQIGIGGSDLGPRAMYLALENWAKKNNTFKMEAKFISNVDPDDAAAVLNSVDVAHSIFVLVSKSGTTLETLTNESFVKDALKKAGLDASKHMIAVTSETSPLAKSDDYLAAFFMDDYIGGRYSSTSAVGGAVLSTPSATKAFPSCPRVS